MSFLIDSSRQVLHYKSRTALALIKSTSTAYRKATTAEEEPKIPDMRLFGSLATNSQEPTYFDNTNIPTPAECATHLELLQVFYVLKQRIIKSEPLDKVFDTEARHQEITRKDGTQLKLKDKDFWTRREVKWTKYLEHAVARFMAWRWTGSHLRAGSDVGCAALPPLDVLMVWHAFLLNPRLFRTTSKELALYKLRFPWREIHDAIDNDDWTFILTKTSSDHFKTMTGLSDDLFEQLSSFACDGPDDIASHLRNLNIDDKADVPPMILSLSKANPTRKHFDAFHKMNSEFARQLRDAVVRQVSFVDKMNAHLWIRSPALDGTITRAISRYSKFLKLYKMYPTTMFVPTLDIDLVWHTHQCSPLAYFTATRNLAGKFVNHDDSIVQGKLDTGYETTLNLYRTHFMEEYPICGCWDCEALLSELQHPVCTKEGTPDLEAMVKKVISDVSYYRHVEIARRHKEPLPIR